MSMTNPLSGPMMRSGERYATAAIELGFERGRGLGGCPTRQRSLRQRLEERADRGVSHRFYQCDDRVRSQNSDIPADHCHAGSVLVDHQRADAGAGLRIAIAWLPGARVSRCLYRCDRAESGEYAVKGDCLTQGRKPLAIRCLSPLLGLKCLPVFFFQDASQAAEFAGALQELASIHADDFSVDVAGAVTYQERREIGEFFNRAEAV